MVTPPAVPPAPSGLVKRSGLSRGRLAFLAFSVTIITAITAGTWAARAAARPATDDSEDSLFKYLSVFSEVLSLVRQAYVDETHSTDLLDAAMDGVSDALDPYSVYVPAAGVPPLEAARRVGLTRSGLKVLNENGLPYVVSVVPGSPAALAGIERGDLVAQVGSRSTRTMPRWQLDAALAGATEKQVELELVRGAEPMNKVLTFGKFDFPLPQLEHREDIAVLRIEWIDDATPARIENVLATLSPQKTKALVIDLRNAAAAEPAAGFAVARTLVNRGAEDLGVLVGRDGPVETFAARPVVEGAAGNRPAWNGQLVVAMNRWTLGGAEVLATVLAQRASARLVGEPTFGAAGRQKSVDLPSGGRLIVTDAYYAGPDLKLLREGIEPTERVRERERSFAERDVSFDEIILRRAIDVARGGATQATTPARAA